MAPNRYRRRFPANRKQKPDHSSYIRSLFQEFLRRKQQAAGKLAPIPEKPRQQPRTAAAETTHRPNLYRESIDRILRQDSGSSNVPDQQSIVKRFFQANKSNNAAQETDVRRWKGPAEPVYARFKRREGTNQFFKCDVSPGAAPTGGLIRWLEDRKRERLEREQRQRAKKVDEYFNLPGDFFSGKPSLPFEMARNPAADKTLASISSTFVPPVASTPLDRPFPMAICSPIFSDPDEIHARKVTVPKPKIDVKSENLEFIEKLKSALDSVSKMLTNADGMINPLDRNYAELKRRLAAVSNSTTSRADETSMVINVQFGCDRKQTQTSLADGEVTGDSSFEREVLQLFTRNVKRTKRIELDPLLTYSPPCPQPDPDLGLPPIPTKTSSGADGMINPVGRNYAKSQRRMAAVRNLTTTPRAEETSMVINVRKQKQNSAVGDVTGDSSFGREMLQLFTRDVKRAKRIEPDPLLTYSPPCPQPDPDLGLPPIPTKTSSDADGMINPVDRNYAKSQRRMAAVRNLTTTPGAEEKSMVINVRKQKQNSAVGDVTGDSSFGREMLQLFTRDVKRTKRIELDPLLTYSPPCPKPDPDLGLPPIRTKKKSTLKSPSRSCLDSSFMTAFLQSPKSKGYYTRPVPKPPEPKGLPVPDFSFLDNDRRPTQQQQQSEFTFEYSQEDFQDPIFPSQDNIGGPQKPAVRRHEVTLDFEDSSNLLEEEASSFSFSQY